MTDPGAPGWYADPWGTPHRRWFDGVAWTPKVWSPETQVEPGDPTAPDGAEPDVATPEPAPIEAATVSRVAQEAQLGRILAAVMPLAALAVVATTISTVVAFRWVADNWSEFVTAAEAGRRLDPVVPGWASALSWIGQLPLLFVVVLFLVWSYQAARAGRDLGHPARRRPGWAVGSWLIPVVNLWWPYGSIADAVPASDPVRVSIRRWWMLWLALLGTSAGVIVSAFLPVAASFFAVGMQGVIAFAAALAARRMIVGVAAAHLVATKR